MICYLMASPQARGLFQRAILQSCTCSDYLSPELKRSIRYFSGKGTAEDAGRHLQRDLGIAPAPNALQQMRAQSAETIVRVSEQDHEVFSFLSAGGTVDGWILSEQPAAAFGAGHQARIPVLLGSNADEGTVALGQLGAHGTFLVALGAVTHLVNYRLCLLRTERLQAATINRKLQAIKKLFGWALDQGLLKKNVAREVRFVRIAERPCPNGLTETEVQSLLRAAGQTRHGLAKRNYALIEMLLETGLRVSEAADLRVSDVDLHDRSGVVLVREGKGRKQRQVPVNSTARRALKLYLKGREPLRLEDHLFLSERGGRPLSLRTIQATVSSLARRAKITRFAVSAHSLRHSFARRFLRRHPGKLVELAALLGHESLDTTAVYTRTSRFTVSWTGRQSVKSSLTSIALPSQSRLPRRRDPKTSSSCIGFAVPTSKRSGSGGHRTLARYRYA